MTQNDDARTLDATSTTVLDCEAGRLLGCQSFCCRLIVRLGPGEIDPGVSEEDRSTSPFKSCVDKDLTTGRCVYQDPESGNCLEWERRPAQCREYDCNEDPRLQIVLRDGFTSLTDLVKAPPVLAERQGTQVPDISPDADSD